MSNERMRNAVLTQGRELQKRVEWLQKMIERQTQTILNAQATAEHFRNELEATHVTTDHLRKRFRELSEDEPGKDSEKTS